MDGSVCAEASIVFLDFLLDLIACSGVCGAGYLTSEESVSEWRTFYWSVKGLPCCFIDFFSLLFLLVPEFRGNALCTLNFPLDA